MPYLYSDSVLSITTASFSKRLKPCFRLAGDSSPKRSEEHTSELQSRPHLVCRLLLEKKKLQMKCPAADHNYYHDYTDAADRFTLDSLHLLSDRLPASYSERSGHNHAVRSTLTSAYAD